MIFLRNIGALLVAGARRVAAFEKIDWPRIC